MLNKPKKKYEQKTSRIGLTIIIGLMLATLIFGSSSKDSNTMMEYCLYLLVVMFIYSIIYDKKDFTETKKITSFTSTIVCLGVIILDMTFYFYFI